MLEQRTLFSGYAISVVAPLPALSTTFVNTQPAALVRDSVGNLYGVVPQGGADTYGAVFEVNPSTKVLTTLYTFDGIRGAQPLALTIDSSGDLFVITQYTTETGSGSTSSPAGYGDLFEFSAANRSTATLLYTFSDTAVGIAPTALVVDSTDKIDVLADGDGANGGGAILQFSPATAYGTATVLGSLTTSHFVYSDSLAIGSDGTLYGTSVDGGGTGQGDGDGTLFSLSPGASTINTVATFDKATTGGDPEGAPYIDASGNVFGTAGSGTSSANFYGDVWEYNISTSTLSTVAAFSDSITTGGTGPEGGVVPDGNGNFLGTTYQSVGASTAGTVFSADPTTHAITDVASFSAATTGNGSFVGLTPDGAGNFYGATSSGAANNEGAVFEVSPSSGSGTGTGGGTGGGNGTTTTGTSALTPTIAKSTLPASVVSGNTIKGAVAVTVTNSGTAASTGVDTFAVYASTTGTFDSSATQVGTLSKKVSLKAGKSSKVNFSFKKLSLPAGTYTLFVQATDASGDTSVSAAGGTVTVAAPFVNLSAAVGAVKPTIAKEGKPISFVVTITNTGNVDSTGPLMITAGLSTDGTTLAVPVTTITKSPKIKANGKATKLTVRFTLPGNLTALSYFPFVSITQGTATATAVGPTFSPVFTVAR